MLNHPPKGLLGLQEILTLKEQIVANMPIESKLMCPHLWRYPKLKKSGVVCYGVDLCLGCARVVKRELEYMGESLKPGDVIE